MCIYIYVYFWFWALLPAETSAKQASLTFLLEEQCLDFRLGRRLIGFRVSMARVYSASAIPQNETGRLIHVCIHMLIIDVCTHIYICIYIVLRLQIGGGPWFRMARLGLRAEVGTVHRHLHDVGLGVSWAKRVIVS